MNALPPPGNTEWHTEAVRTLMTRELSATFAGGPYAAAAARRALGGLGDVISNRRLGDIALLVSELVTNSVRHGGAGEDDVLELAAFREGERLRVEVTDWGPGFDGDARPRLPTDAEGGWGLVLVERLADRWGVERDGDATVVWFELSTPDRAKRARVPLHRHIHPFSLN
jgi:anti-sigma regulatory factor (Ser/Thr protein kinase)